eukprot:1162115-Pelagomonas_calceolata.AAC.9
MSLPSIILLEEKEEPLRDTSPLFSVYSRVLSERVFIKMCNMSLPTFAGKRAAGADKKGHC